MITVAKLLQDKGREIWHASLDDSIFDVMQIMESKEIGAVPVLNEQALIGILSERDCARKMILNNLAPKKTRVRDIMTRQVYYTFPGQDVEECLAVMSEHHIRHMPVVENDRVVGMISMGDVVKELLALQRDKIEHLEHYISWEESY